MWRNHLLNARWFQAKGMEVELVGLEPLEWEILGADCSVRSELLKIRAGGAAEVYQLLVAYMPPGSVPPELAVGRVDVPGLGQREAVEATDYLPALDCYFEALRESVAWRGLVPPRAEPKVFTGEQSNTNIRYGDVMLKLFRRISKEPSVEIELLGALNLSFVPTLRGILENPARPGLQLGMFIDYIPDSTDGWTWATEACKAGEPIGDDLRGLGAMLAKLHRVMARLYGKREIPATQISAQMLAHLDKAVGQVPKLAELEASLAKRLQALGEGPVEVQRIHGDFHLGQVLRSPAGWTIIDFEGEPLKTPAQRRAFDSRWRDVAGLTRSIDYARFFHPDAQGSDGWYEQAREGFLAGYGLKGTSPALLYAYETDKAIYELVYETRNRPTWARIPWQAVEKAGTNEVGDK
jgi:maltokinase